MRNARRQEESGTAHGTIEFVCSESVCATHPVMRDGNWRARLSHITALHHTRSEEGQKERFFRTVSVGCAEEC